MIAVGEADPDGAQHGFERPIQAYLEFASADILSLRGTRMTCYILHTQFRVLGSARGQVSELEHVSMIQNQPWCQT